MAAAIVELAFSDYIDAQIVINTNGAPMNRKKFTKRVFKRVITYGKLRYCYKTKDGRYFTRSQESNLRELWNIQNLLADRSRLGLARAEKRRLVNWFYSDQFDIFMPHTNKEWVIRTLNERANMKRRITNGLPSLYD